MRIVTFTCDLCGQEATERVSAYWHHLPDRANVYDQMTIDLCPACAERVRGTLDKEREDN